MSGSEILDLDTPLGRKAAHSRTYRPEHLCPIPRKMGRESLGLSGPEPPFFGVDIWNVYELSWLEPGGKPVAVMAELRVPVDSPCLIESKSLKLYLNSLNMTRFKDGEAVRETMEADLSRAADSPVEARLIPPGLFSSRALAEPQGTCLDDQEITGFDYQVRPDHLKTNGQTVEELVFSRLLRTCCPVTGQPDWATVEIGYQGPGIDHPGLLRYLVSFREHTGFHEACVERIFMDLIERCSPGRLTVTARFTRRGGIDINPVRSSQEVKVANRRDPRQ